MSTKIPNSHIQGGGGGGGACGNQFPTFDAESKFAKIQNSHVQVGGGGGLMEINFQLLMQSPNLLKSKIPMCTRKGGGGGGAHGNHIPKVNFKFYKSSPKMKFSFCVWGGGGLMETNFQKSTSNFLSPVLN